MSRPARLERRTPDLHVIAEWTDAGTTLIAGPQRVVIEAGHVDAGVLRRLDHHLHDMTAEHFDAPSVGGYRTMVRQWLRNRLAELPTSGNAYHQALLDLHDEATTKLEGRLDTDLVLADAMHAPQETMQACLQVARQHAGR